jgi:DNA polymerase-3 subunit gamma/tau
MGQALYRKYRPKSLAELIGQEHITTTLGNALKSGRISHAYLLTGPRGVGKTSIARILAHEINKLPYEDEAHLDIIEIDAASNRRIDEIRDLRDRVNTAPASAKYKVYIIDEVHMLTKEAFNALLKTLEEPPAHVVFILATTEAHKLPETIVSRTQRYSFRPVAHEQVVKHLKTIAGKEKITIDDEALALLARHGEGSFRDSISLLDQASNITDKVTKSDVEQMLGLAPQERIQALQAAVQEHQNALVVSVLSELYAQGYEPAMIAVQLGEILRNAVLANSYGGPAAAALALLQCLLDIPAARAPKQLLELVLLQAAFLPAPAAPQLIPDEAHKKVSQPTPPPQPKLPSANPKPIEQMPDKAVRSAMETAAIPLPEAQKTTTMQSPEVLTLWQEALDEIKKQHNTLYGIARMATPELEDSKLTLHVKFAFHQKRLNEARNRKIFSDVIERLSGRPIEIVCVINDKPTTAAARPDVTTISNIFGGAELLES